jgi:MFS family permease
VRGPLDAGNVAVGVVIGAYAITGLFSRPFAGRLADQRGRRPAVVLGCLIASLAGLLYLVPAGVGGLIVARLVLGVGEGMVFTAGSAWIVDLAPASRRGRVIGLYGLAVWGGLSLGPPIGALLLQISSYELVWAFAAAAPLLGALVAVRLPDAFRAANAEVRGPLVARESVRPGLALALASVGYAAVAGFVVLHLDARGIGHGPTVFAAFAAMVVLTRLVGGDLPDRLGPARCALAAALAEAAGLAAIAFAGNLTVALIGALAMGSAFSLLYPSLSLIVVGQVPEERRGAALGTFTAFFDAGVGLGAPLAGAAAALSDYEGAFLLAAASSLAAAALIGLALSARGRAALAGELR